MRNLERKRVELKKKKKKKETKMERKEKNLENVINDLDFGCFYIIKTYCFYVLKALSFLMNALYT